MTDANRFPNLALINGIWVDAPSSMEVTDPATGAAIARIPALRATDCRLAIDAAAAALPDWRRRTAADRGRLIRRWYELVLARLDDLAAALTAEQGKPLAEARAEIHYAASFLDWFAEEGRRAYGQVIPAHQPNRYLQVLRQPVGVVAAITPWNFPAAMVTRKLAPALSAGCTVVLKPSELTPLTALALAALAQEAGIPQGVLNVVTGVAAEVSEPLLDDPRVAKLTFTGSTTIGKMLTARCAATMKRVSMELGGNAPFIVFGDANLEEAADGLMQAKFRNAGQTCVCANRVLVQEDILDRFTEIMAARIEGLRVGPGADAGVQIGPLIHEGAATRVRGLVQASLADGAQLITGGGQHAAGPAFVTPGLLTGVNPASAIARQEIFGPIAAVQSFRTEEEALHLANDSPAGLAAYVYTTGLDRHYRVIDQIAAGMVGVNTGLISSEVLPFGGIKESGLGREGGACGIDEFMEMKSVCMAIGR